MRQALLWRQKTSDEGTFGVLVCDDKLHLQTIELPERDNKAFGS